MQRLRGIKRLGTTGLTAAVLIFGAQSAPHAAPLDLSTTPLFLKTGVAPNIVVTLDDSGSMARDYMPDDRSGNGHERFYSATYNGVAYNPNVTYTPPMHADGTPFSASFTDACSNGIIASGCGKDLSASDGYISTKRTLWGSYQTWPAFYAVFDSSNIPSPLSLTLTCNPAINNNAIENDDCYDQVIVRTDEQKNFANWYSFYRTRNLATITGASRAFANLGGDIRVGWQRLNTSTTIKPVQPFTGKHRTDFYTWLFALPHDNGTPLRIALKRAGDYFKTDQPYYNNAENNDDGSASCRQNYHVLMSDGLWNGSFSGLGNSDNSSPTMPDGTSYSPRAPFQDDTGDTLADVAFNYWAADLSGLADNVPPYMPQQGGSGDANYWNAQNDPANWQHMVNFTIGLGLGPSLAKAGLTWEGNTYTGSYPDLAADTDPLPWPAAEADKPSAVADLWHAAINSRGQFFSADDPQALSEAFKTVLNRIADRTSSGTSVALESGAIAHSDNVYIARFNSRDWTGQVVAYKLTDTGDIGAPVWDAACALTGGACATDGKTYDGKTESTRRIVTWNPQSDMGGVPFAWDELSPTQQDALNGDNDNELGKNRLLYLRGDRAQESNGAFRNRKGLLGDVVDATPVYVGPPDRFYPDDWGTIDQDDTPEDQATGGATYNVFKTAHKERPGVVYVGANDGMLHAFAADDGEELFAYVPSAVYSHLSELTEPSYNHRFYVDGTPTEGDAFFGGAWHTVLVGGLRAGGQGIYALDITDVPADADETTIADKVLWEFTDTDLGYTYSQPQIVRLHDGHWAAVFGNGYNSDTGNAVLYAVNIADGSLITKIKTDVGTADNPNGLATVTTADIDGDLIVDYAYAGDLYGNLWKFDLRGKGSWSVAYNKPLFKAVDADGASQPITTRPSIRRHPTGEGFLLMFGTGKYLEGSDATASTDIQSVYGIWDRDGDSLASFTRSNLLEQTIQQETTVNGTDYRIISDNPLTWYTGTDTITKLPPKASDPAEQQYLGWYLDLKVKDGPALGEMQVTDSLVRGNRLIFTTLIPNEDPCSLGGESWLMVLDYRDGGRFNPPVFDTNNDGIFDLDDLVEADVGNTDNDGDDDTEKVSVGGQKSNNILQTPALGALPNADRAYLGGSDGKGTDCAGQDCTDLGRDPATRNRQSWRQLR